MTPIRRRLLYIFRGTLLRLRITWQHRTLTLSVGCHVDRVDSKGRPKWDGSRCRLNTSHGPDRMPAAAINRSLDALEADIDTAFATFEADDRIPEPDELRRAIKGETVAERTVGDAFDRFIEDGANIAQWSQSSIRKMRTMKRLLLKFRPNVTFADFTPAMLADFMAWQTRNAVVDESANERAAEKQKVKYKGYYQNDTINRNLRNLKWFLRWAEERGHRIPPGWRDFDLKYRTIRKPVVFLTWNELTRLRDFDLGLHPELSKIRDMFCFCAYTSLRYSDMIKLKWADVTPAGDMIRITTQKTADTLDIDLNRHARAILDRYRREDAAPTDTVFDSKSSQKMNVRIKQICRMCGIDTPVSFVEIHGSERKEITMPKHELISTHAARRTFISNAMMMGIPPDIVMKWTGHSDYKSMRPYIAIADEARRASMHLFDRD